MVALFRKKAAGAIAVGLAATLALTCTALVAMRDKGAHPKSSPGFPATSEDGFPVVDWEYWSDVNPAVIGWITIPGTNIDQPVVQAPEWDPQYYLTHDVFGDWNYMGCPYLDAECAEWGLLRCPNSAIFGHNMGWNQDIFGDLEFYADPEFADSHREVLIQQPGRKSRLLVQACEVIPGWKASKRTSFECVDDYLAWWRARFRESEVKLAPEAGDDGSLATLCTCSYGSSADERTIVYCLVSDEWDA